MSIVSARVGLRTIDNIALAYFFSPANLNDAVRDLCIAGFHADHINIAKRAHSGDRSPDGDIDPVIDNAIGAHTLRWEWNRTLAHDRHRMGADQMAGLNPTPSEGPNPTCCHLDLPFALAAMAIPQGMIHLLERETLKGAVYLMVDAQDRVIEANTILSGNAGQVRTDYLRGLSA